jgi:hypothetical protein
VVEVENIQIRLSAVDAGVIDKVVTNPASEILRLSNSSHVSRRDLFLTVSVIPLLGVCPLARKADPLTRLTDEGPEWEFRKGLRFSADPTTAQTEGRVER